MTSRRLPLVSGMLPPLTLKLRCQGHVRSKWFRARLRGIHKAAWSQGLTGSLAETGKAVVTKPKRRCKVILAT